MRPFSEAPAVYLHRAPVDFRKSINDLSVIVEQAMRLSPYSPGLFVFCNRQHNRLKVLYWDKTGFCLWYKRLEQDRFKWPRKEASDVITLSNEQFDWLLRGFDIGRMQSHKSLHYSVVA